MSEHQNHADKFKILARLVDDVFQLMPTRKHMIGRDLGNIEPTASLHNRAARRLSENSKTNDFVKNLSL